jgi:hypothetical protein
MIGIILLIVFLVILVMAYFAFKECDGLLCSTVKTVV